MSRRTRRHSAPRDAFDIARPRLRDERIDVWRALESPTLSPPRSLFVGALEDFLESPGPLREYQDRRTWSPGHYSPPVVIGGKGARLSMPSRPFEGFSPVIRFREPERTLVCVRRQQRREVMHARGKAGGRVSAPRRREFSDVSCKR